MRFKNDADDYKIYAVSGTNTVAFAIDCDEAAMRSLLGFMVEKEYRNDDGNMVRVTVMGFKVFRERIENPVPGALYSTFDNPIQSFTWEDFSSAAGKQYTYYFTPLYDNPLNIRRGAAVSIVVETEPLWKAGDHSVFFNRGTASSQAYAVEFSNKPPDQVADGKAFDWLSRGLKEAIYKFIDDTAAGEELYCCFYEFHFDGVLDRLRMAADRSVRVHIVYDAKENEHPDSETGRLIESFPRVANQKAIKIAKLDVNNNVTLIPRERNKSYISHNKFMVRVQNGIAQSLWTGSTNISEGGIFGQTNVGHAVDDPAAANSYFQYWQKLSEDPDSVSLKRRTEELQADLTDVNNIPAGVTCLFSPRKELNVLKFYADLLDSAESCGCITLAFGIHKYFSEVLSDNRPDHALTFLLLEKDAEGLFDYIYKNNVVKAVGSDIPDNSVFKWVNETTTKSLGLNTHVMYVHTKFLLRDPLGENPITVTGSANFSEAATDKNDENMLIINGNRRVADIYFTEFLRIFNHYYFRWIVTRLHAAGAVETDNPAFMKPDDSWTEQYKPGKFKRQRVEIFANMFMENKA